MLMLRLLLLAILLGPVPLAAGLLPARFMDARHQSLGMSYLCGWLLLFGLAQILLVPFIVLERDFAEASAVYGLAALFLALAGAAAGWRTAGTCLRATLRPWREKGRGLWLLVVLLVALQMAAAVWMQYLDGDDALYVTISRQTQTGDGMYLKNPYYGYAQTLDARHALSPVPILIAFLGRLTGLHTTVLSHSLLAPALLLVMYVGYGQIGRCLFPERPERVPLFLVFLNLWYLFGNVSLYTAETFAYTRTWQGKAMFGNLIMPAALLFVLFAARDEMRPGEWAMLPVLSAAAAFTTSTGIFLFPVFLALAGLILAVLHRKPALLVSFAACCVPGAAFGVLYLFLR